MRMSFAPVMLLLWFVPGCGGGGDDAAPPPAGVPAAAAALDTAMKSSLVRVMPLAANVQSSLIFVLNPGSVLSQGVTLTPDTSAGAPPHAFVLDGSFDGNGDGHRETRMTGRVVFATDPAVGWSSVSGQMMIDVSIPLVGHVYRATVDYTMNSTQATVSGSGTFTNPATGTTTTLTVPANAPLVIKPATGAAGALANACGHSIDGSAQLAAAATSGTLRTTAAFSANSSSVGLRSTTFVDSGGQTTSLPDSTTDLRCGGSSAAITDWVATYDVRWACLPQESGQFRTTIAANGASALAITDQGSTSSYDAALVGSSPHAVRGFFIEGPTGSRYREDFNWTLLKNGDFTEFSTYRFFEGAFTGNGGVCAGTGRRVS